MIEFRIRHGGGVFGFVFRTKQALERVSSEWNEVIIVKKMKITIMIYHHDGCLV